MQDDPELKTLLQSILNQEAALKSLRGQRARPVSTRRRFYYNADQAQIVKKIVDYVLETGVSYIVPNPYGHSPITLKLQYYHGLDYLKTELDTTYQEKAKNLKCVVDGSHVEILRRSKPIIKGLSEPLLANGTFVDAEWRDAFEEWLLSQPALHSKFSRPLPGQQFLLTIEDKAWISKQLEGIEHLFLLEALDNKLLVIRYDN